MNLTQVLYINCIYVECINAYGMFERKSSKQNMQARRDAVSALVSYLR